MDDDGKLTTTAVPLNGRPEVAQMLHTTIVFCVLVAFFTGLRIYSHQIRKLSLNLSDWFFYASVVCFYAMIVALFIVIYFGAVGYHMDQLGEQHVARLTQSLLVIQALYGLSMCCCKWSILWTLKTIFAVRIFKIITWVIIVFQAIWVIMTVLIGLLVCRPIVKNWDPTADGVCGNQIAAYTAVSVYNIIIDVIMCVLPLPMILKLQLDKRYKMALFAIFSVGIVTVSFAVVRLFALRSIDFNDFAYTFPEAATWTFAEVGVVIMVACCPLLRPVFDKVFYCFVPKRNKSTGATHGSGDYLSSSTPQRSKIIRRSDGFHAMHDSEENLVELGAVNHQQTQITGGSQTKGNEKADGKGGIIVESEVTIQ
ncbi:hypothetical protein F4779DRAFT_632897 [Xylariaceae sp. FL0662B]|nr:hypothetical protein F4779DRAFT_632897 [Xylariaceae sp. FL0662B]